jgi:hypothetical protein
MLTQLDAKQLIDANVIILVRRFKLIAALQGFGSFN